MNTTPQELTPTTVEALREELTRVRRQLAQYVGHEPTIAEEMRHIREENDFLRKIVAYLLAEYVEKPTVDLWDDDINHKTGVLDIEPSPDRRDSTRITYTHVPAVPHGAGYEPNVPIGRVPAAGHADLRDANTLLRRRERAMRDLVATHIAKGLASREAGRWEAARALAQALDEADANLDNQIDEQLADDGWDPRSAWKVPASLVPADDPWAPVPNTAGDVPEAVRRVLVTRLVEMLLASQSEEVIEQARRITYALKAEGADLTDAIRARITDLTLGPDPADPPF